MTRVIASPEPDALLLPSLALHLDNRLDLLRAMTLEDLARYVDRDAHLVERRRTRLMDILVWGADLHGWRVEWDARGLRLHDGDHELVVGVPSVVREFLGLNG